MGYESFKLQKDIKSKLNYLVYLPQSYNTNNKLPLILSLHGSGERGTNIDDVKKWGIHRILRENDYNIDDERIYLTGYSLGGYGTWNFAILEPERFTAIVPISGGAISPQKALRLKNIPIWVAHGDSDTVVQFEESKRIVDCLKEYNPNIIFKVYKGGGHEVCTTAYEEPELFQWLVKQKKKKKL